MMREVDRIPVSRYKVYFAGHPTGLATLFFTEMWERFSYYGMRALLVLYMTAPAATGGLGFRIDEAALIYGNYTMAVYLLALPGGFFADAFLGPRRAMLAGGVAIACGHYALVIHSSLTFYCGLSLIAFGSGLFKPSISAMVGVLYLEGDARRDAGFSIFYMGINIGALIAPLVTGFLAQSAWFKAWLVARGFDPGQSWHWGFGAAGVGMTLALLCLCMRQSVRPSIYKFASISANLKRRSVLVGTGTFSLLVLGILSDAPRLLWLRLVFLIVPLIAIAWYARQPSVDAQRIAATFVFFIATMVFWTIFEQAGLSISIFADRFARNEVMGFIIPSSWFQALNPLLVIALTPLFAAIWTAWGHLLSAPIKFCLGFAFLAMAMLLMAAAAALMTGGKVSPLWLFGLFLLLTIGELCFSPVGLSIMTKLAPKGHTGLMLGIWFLGSAWGNKLAGVLGAEIPMDAPETLIWFFLKQAGIAVIAVVVLGTLTPCVKRLMSGIA
jgi:POT family proton-dependent oligopeptide transporter